MSWKEVEHDTMPALRLHLRLPSLLLLRRSIDPEKTTRRPAVPLSMAAALGMLALNGSH